MEPLAYTGFISYSQKDAAAAARLHRWLEHFKISRDVAEQLGRPTSLGRFFRDDDEMTASSDITQQINDALHRSDSLIVVCSPNSAQSKWVEAEIQQFRETGRGDRVFAYIIDGVPNSGDPETECFPPSLRLGGEPDGAQLPIEPFGLDVRKDGRDRACARLAAGLIQVDFDTLWQRHRRRTETRNRLVFGGMASLILVFAALALIATNLGFEARKNLNRYFAERSWQELEDVNFNSAARYALAGMELSPANASEYQSALAGVLHATNDSFSPMMHNGGVKTVAFSPDGALLATAGRENVARIWSVSDQSLIAEFSGHTDQLNTVEFSSDGSQLLTSSWDGTARLWQVETGDSIVLRGHTDRVNLAKFSPPGTPKRILTTSRDSSAIIWDGSTGAKLHDLDGHKENIRAAAFFPDGDRVATASTDQTLKIWDLNALDAGAITLEGHSDSVWSVNVSPNGEYVLSASEDMTAKLWDASGGGTAIRTFRDQDSVWNAVFSNDGEWVITAGRDWIPRIWATETGALLHELKGHKNEVLRVRFDHSGSRVMTSSYDQTAIIWDPRTGTRLATIGGHGDQVWTAAFSPADDLIATASMDHTARLWRATDGRLRKTIDADDADLWTAEYTQDESRILYAGDDQMIRVQSATDPSQPPIMLTGHAGAIYDLALSPSGHVLASASADGTARLWDLDRQSELLQIAGHGDEVNSVVFSKDGAQLLTAGYEGMIRLWDRQTGRELQVYSGHEDMVWSALFSPDGQHIASAGEDGTVRLWDAASGQQTQVLDGHDGPVTWVDYSHDGRLLVSAGDDATARVWDTESGELVSLLSGEAYWIHRARFSPDGARIATASNGGSADIWNTSDGRHLAALTENTGAPNKVQSVAFSKDGRRLLTANSDGIVREWDVSRLTQSWDTLSADACSNLLIPATQTFSEAEILADPLLATQSRRSDRNVCAAQSE